MRSSICVVLACLAGLAFAQEAQKQQQPADSKTTEKVTVRLIQVDTLVMEKNGETVPGLTKDDFELRFGDQPMKIDTFDAFCPIGATPDPTKNITGKGKHPEVPKPIGPDVARKIVLAFDYSFLPIPDRKGVLDAAQAMVQLMGTDKEEIMVVALASGVRVEQKFTTKRNEVINTVRRMEVDKSLWPLEFPVGSSGRGYFDQLTTLMDVLAAYPGSKAVVLFSDLQSLGTGSSYDLWYSDVATHAAAAQTVIYPAMTSGIQAGSGARTSDALARFANQSGGRMTMIAEDLSIPYRRAQRDLSCRYTLGIYVDPDDARTTRELHVKLTKPEHELRYPEMARLFTDDQIRESRLRAAFADPGPYEHPLVRAIAFPAHPSGANSWDTLFAVTFPMPYYPGGGDFNVEATLQRGSTRVNKYQNRFYVPPPDKKGEARPVTIMGHNSVKVGQYSFTVVLSEPTGDRVVSAESDFTVPAPPQGLLILRGPLLARVDPGGKLIHALSNKKNPGPTRLDEVVGKDSSFEPLVVHEIRSSDELLTYWNACIYGKSELTSSAVVHRKFLDSEGKTVHELDPLPLKLASVGSNVSCQDDLERIAAQTLAKGEYQYEVTVTYANSGDLVARGAVPLLVD